MFREHTIGQYLSRILIHIPLLAYVMRKFPFWLMKWQTISVFLTDTLSSTNISQIICIIILYCTSMLFSITIFFITQKVPYGTSLFIPVCPKESQLVASPHASSPKCLQCPVFTSASVILCLSLSRKHTPITVLSKPP